MRYEVPQFIDVEDKIFGPFTWKQFLYLTGGFGGALILFFVTPFFIFLMTSIPLVVLSAALAFYPVNQRPFAHFLESVFTYFSRSRLYLWKKEEKKASGSKAETTPAQLYTPPSKNTIASLSRKLELNAMEKKDQAT